MSSQLAKIEAADFVEALDRQIQESIANTDYGWQTIAHRGDASATFTGGQRGPQWWRAVPSIYDRDEGRYYPYYVEERDLEEMRAKARHLGTFTSVAIGAMQALSVYTMGGEWEYKFAGKQDAPQLPSPQLLNELNAILKATLDRNQWMGEFDCELHDHSREDGDLVVAGYKASDGLCDFRRLDADMLKRPANEKKLNDWLDVAPKNSWTFGVHTIYDERMRRIDHERAIGFHVCFDDGGREWDYLPAWPQSHGDETLCDKFGHLIKRNTPRSAKRGTTDYWQVQTDLERDAKLSENLAVGAAVLAGIPWFENFAKGTTRDQAEGAMKRGLSDYSKAASLNLSSTGESRYVQKRPPGTVVKASQGVERTMGPLGQIRQPIYIEVCQHLRRSIGLRWLMPEYMISGDASNANFASTLVSESPFVKAREADQRFYVAHFKAILWKAIKVAVDHGRFKAFNVSFADIVSLCDLQIQPPMVASRDKANHLAELNQLWQAGLLAGNEYRVDLKREPKPEYEEKTYSPQMLPGQFEQGLANLGRGEQPPPGGQTAAPKPKPDGPSGGGEKPPQPAGDQGGKKAQESLQWVCENCGTGAGGFQTGNDCQCDDCGGSRVRSGYEEIEVGSQQIKARINPTLDQLKQYFAKHKEVRGILDEDTGDVTYWPAEQATHDEVARELRIKLNRDTPTVYMRDPSRLEKNHAIMQHLAKKARQQELVASEEVLLSLRDDDQGRLDRKENLRAEAFTRAIDGARTIDEAKAVAGRYAEGRWVTLNAGDDGGTPAYIDDGGKVQAGPAALKGKDLEDATSGGKKPAAKSPTGRQ